MSKNAKKKTAAPRPAAAPEAQASEKPTYQERMRKMKPHERVRFKLEWTVERFKHIVDELGTWTNKEAGDLTSSAKTALTHIEEVLDQMNGLPKDFIAVRPRKASESSLKPGMRVDIKDKHSEVYDGIIEEKDRKGLDVLDTRVGRVVCKTRAGEKVILPRGHVEPSAVAPAKASAKKVA